MTRAISGISASAWPRFIGCDSCASNWPASVSRTAAAQASSAVSMARISMISLYHGSVRCARHSRVIRARHCEFHRRHCNSGCICRCSRICRIVGNRNACGTGITRNLPGSLSILKWRPWLNKYWHKTAKLIHGICESYERSSDDALTADHASSRIPPLIPRKSSDVVMAQYSGLAKRWRRPRQSANRRR